MSLRETLDFRLSHIVHRVWRRAAARRFMEPYETPAYWRKYAVMGHLVGRGGFVVLRDPETPGLCWLEASLDRLAPRWPTVRIVEKLLRHNGFNVVAARIDLATDVLSCRKMLRAYGFEQVGDFTYRKVLK